MPACLRESGETRSRPLQSRVRIELQYRVRWRGSGCQFPPAATPGQFAREYQSLAGQSSALLISTRWLEKRKPHWNKLEDLLNISSQKGLKSLTRYDLQELSLLYRQTAADL